MLPSFNIPFFQSTDNYHQSFDSNSKIQHETFKQINSSQQFESGTSGRKSNEESYRVNEINYMRNYASSEIPKEAYELKVEVKKDYNSVSTTSSSFTDDLEAAYFELMRLKEERKKIDKVMISMISTFHACSEKQISLHAYLEEIKKFSKENFMLMLNIKELQNIISHNQY
jgi:hypothetical protein